MGFWDDIGESLKFEKFQLSEWWDNIKENPEQMILGANDPLGAEIWGGITGKDYEPQVNLWGGPTGATFEKAEAEGIDTERAQQIHEVAEGIAKAYTLNWGLDKMGAAFQTEGGESKFDADTIRQGFQQFQNSMAQQQQAELDKEMKVPPPMQQGAPPGETFGPPPAPGMAVAPPGAAIIPEPAPAIPAERPDIEAIPPGTFPRRV